MADAHAPGSAGPGKARMEALTDGIFAFAMTLLVLGIGIPNPMTVPPAELADYVSKLLPEVLLFVLSFAVCGVYWVGHHQFMHVVARSDRVLLWLNIAFCMTIALIPFTTGMLGHYPEQRIALIAYGANTVLTGVCLNLLRAYATRASLLRPDMDPVVARLARNRMLVGPVLYLAAIGAAFVDGRLSLLLFAVPPIYYILPGAIDPHLAHRKGEHG